MTITISWKLKSVCVAIVRTSCPMVYFTIFIKISNYFNLTFFRYPYPPFPSTQLPQPSHLHWSQSQSLHTGDRAWPEIILVLKNSRENKFNFSRSTLRNHFLIPILVSKYEIDRKISLFSSRIRRLKDRYSRSRLKAKDWMNKIPVLVSKHEIKRKKFSFLSRKLK